jgi:hypothetical protein
VRKIYFLSDHSGVTAETFGHSLITQFNNKDFRQETLPFINTKDKAKDVVSKINQDFDESAMRPIIFATLVRKDLRLLLRTSHGLYLDIFDVFLKSVEKELQQESAQKVGRSHGMSDIESYMNRIEATNFALTNDDGGFNQNYDEADVILIGVSRTGKTPTCLYLALQYGIYAANFPLTDEELDQGMLPKFLKEQKKKIFGLTIEPKRLRQIRKKRRELGKYSTTQQVRYELREAEKLFKRYSIPYIDTTVISIEEISSRILDQRGIERKL